MKRWHSLQFSVFIKQDEDYAKIRQSFLSFLPFDLENEKITVKESTAQGFHEIPINILEVLLSKEKHIDQFLEHLSLSEEQKNLLLRQKESRLDEQNCFFIRFDKEKFVDEKKLFITDSGNCFHLKLHIAVFPAKREKAMEVIEAFLKT